MIVTDYVHLGRCGLAVWVGLWFNVTVLCSLSLTLDVVCDRGRFWLPIAG